MHPLIGLLLLLATVLAMEIFAYAAHRWVMHGPGWFLHASHHRPRAGNWEWNDLYAVIFAVPSIEAVTKRLPSGEKSASSTSRSWNTDESA